MRRFVPFALRDLVIVGLMVAVAIADARTRAAGDASGAGIALGIATGVLVTVAAFLLHEWGHLTGAIVTGGRVDAPRRLASIFLFEFDEAASTREQFLAMSAGGYLASLVAIALIAIWIQLGSASGITTLVLAGGGIAATFALEMPKTWKVYRSAS